MWVVHTWRQGRSPWLRWQVEVRWLTEQKDGLNTNWPLSAFAASHVPVSSSTTSPYRPGVAPCFHICINSAQKTKKGGKERPRQPEKQVQRCSFSLSRKIAKLRSHAGAFNNPYRWEETPMLQVVVIQEGFLFFFLTFFLLLLVPGSDREVIV